MIANVIWPKIKQSVEKYTLQKGIPLSPNCGIDPPATDIKFTEHRAGLSTNLHLSNFDQVKCLADWKSALPKLDGIL